MGNYVYSFIPIVTLGIPHTSWASMQNIYIKLQKYLLKPNIPIYHILYPFISFGMIPWEEREMPRVIPEQGLASFPSVDFCILQILINLNIFLTTQDYALHDSTICKLNLIKHAADDQFICYSRIGHFKITFASISRHPSHNCYVSNLGCSSRTAVWNHEIAPPPLEPNLLIVPSQAKKRHIIYGWIKAVIGRRWKNGLRP